MGAILSMVAYSMFLYIFIPIACVVAIGAASDWMTKARESRATTDATKKKDSKENSRDTAASDSMKQVLKDALKDIVKGVGIDTKHIGDSLSENLQNNGEDAFGELGELDDKALREANTKELIEAEDLEEKHFLFDILKQLIYRCEISEHNKEVFDKMLGLEYDQGKLMPFQKDLLSKILLARFKQHKKEHTGAENKGALSFVILRDWAATKTEEGVDLGRDNGQIPKSNANKDSNQEGGLTAGDVPSEHKIKHSASLQSPESARGIPSMADMSVRTIHDDRDVDLEREMEAVRAEIELQREVMKKAEKRFRRIAMDPEPWRELLGNKQEKEESGEKERLQQTLDDALDFLDDGEKQRNELLERVSWEAVRPPNSLQHDSTLLRSVFLESAAIMRNLARSLRIRIQDRHHLGYHNQERSLSRPQSMRGGVGGVDNPLIAANIDNHSVEQSSHHHHDVHDNGRNPMQDHKVPAELNDLPKHTSSFHGSKIATEDIINTHNGVNPKSINNVPQTTSTQETKIPSLDTDSAPEKLNPDPHSPPMASAPKNSPQFSPILDIDGGGEGAAQASSSFRQYRKGGRTRDGSPRDTGPMEHDSEANSEPWVDRKHVVENTNEAKQGFGLHAPKISASGAGKISRSFSQGVTNSGVDDGGERPEIDTKRV